MFMSAADYRESLRQYKPRVFIDGQAVTSVADEPLLAPGIRAIGVTYDFALKPELKNVMVAVEQSTGKPVNRMLHINRENGDVLNKLEAVRLVCQESGCAQRYLTQDAMNGIFQATHRIDTDKGTDYHQRLRRRRAEDRRRGIAKSRVAA